jgi:hypothetical protein
MLRGIVRTYTHYTILSLSQIVLPLATTRTLRGFPTAARFHENAPTVGGNPSTFHVKAWKC